MKDEALRKAEHALDGVLQVPEKISTMHILELVRFIRKAREEIQQEPVAWVRWEWNRSGIKSLVFKKPEELSLAETATGVVYDPLYTSPPAQRKPLTEIELLQVYESEQKGRWGDHVRGLRAVEIAHNIKENA